MKGLPQRYSRQRIAEAAPAQRMAWSWAPMPPPLLDCSASAMGSRTSSTSARFGLLSSRESAEEPAPVGVISATIDGRGVGATLCRGQESESTFAPLALLELSIPLESGPESYKTFEPNKIAMPT
jgi:hypothetical protein